MDIKKLTGLSAVVVFSLMLGGGVLAQDQPEVTDQELCQMEAEEAGMMDENDIHDYVEQCLDELHRQEEPNNNSSDSESESFD